MSSIELPDSIHPELSHTALSGVGMGIDEEGRKNILEQVFYIDNSIEEAHFKQDDLHLSARTPLSEETKTRLTALCVKVHRSFKRAKLDVRRETPGIGLTPPSISVYDALLKRGDIIESMPGHVVMTGPTRALIANLDSWIRNKALSIGAQEHSYPILVPLQSLLDNQYLANFPQHAMMVSALHEDMDGLLRFSETAAQGDASALSAHVQDQGRLKGVLSTTVCHHCFEALRQTVADNALTIYTACNPCHRYESRNTRGLERLQCFTMRELIFLGTQEEVLKQRQEVLEWTWAWVERVGLKARLVVASDPFFAVSASRKRAFQHIFELKYELQAWLPQRERWLAVGSFNHHMDTMVKYYHISPNDAQEGELTSGCIGYGLERLALALLSQFGLDTDQWPLALRESLNEVFT